MRHDRDDATTFEPTTRPVRRVRPDMAKPKGKRPWRDQRPARPLGWFE
jgi:hypothetical protein